MGTITKHTILHQIDISYLPTYIDLNNECEYLLRSIYGLNFECILSYVVAN